MTVRTYDSKRKKEIGLNSTPLSNINSVNKTGNNYYKHKPPPQVPGHTRKWYRKL